MLKITEGKEKRPLKVIIYGPEGIGKTTFASMFPFPLFIDTEGGTSNLNVRRVKCNQSWSELLQVANEVIANPSICKTLVVDTADWSESLCVNAVCEKYRKTNIEEFGYGKGYTYLADEYSRFIALLDKCIEAGINVVVTAHGKPRKFELPDEAGAFDRYEMKLSKQVAPLLKEWCDLLLFCNYKTYVVSTETGSKKAQGGKRVVYTSHHPCWDAKNRFDLPEELDMSFEGIAHLFEDLTEAPEKPKKTTKAPKERIAVTKVKTLLGDALMSEDDLKQVVASKGHYPIETPIDDYSDDFISRWIIPNWKKIVEIVTNKNGGNN